jgi:dipeptidyl aminopeptidase/acylaminoacyl peptidase
MVFSTSVDPRWLKHSDRFWYTYETTEGKFFHLVDPVKRTKAPLFDNVKMAAELTRLTQDPYDHQHLPIRTIKFVKDDKAIQFDVESSQDEEDATAVKQEEQKTPPEPQQRQDRDQSSGKKKKVLHFEYDIATGQLTLLKDFEPPQRPPAWASISPDEKWVVFARNHNLFVMDKANYEKYMKEKKELEKSKKKEEREKEPEVAEQQLTTDGEEYYSYASLERGQSDKDRQKNKGKRQPVRIVWSKDSRRFALVRSNQRKVEDLWVVNSVAQPRPTLETYKYDMPGEKSVTQYEVHVLDIEGKSQAKMKVDRFKDQSVSILQARQRPRPDEDRPQPSLWLADNSDQLFFSRTSRDMHKVDICVADARTGDVKVLIEERLNTYIETQRLELCNGGKELIHWSERDGWGHYYLFDADGKLKNQITSGPFSCRSIAGVDEKSRVLYFSANGREQGEDPYYQHLYRVNLDGTGLKLLDPGNFNHSVNMNESSKYVVDTYSRVDTTPQSVLFDSTGARLLDLETADLSLLSAAGYKFPETFKVKADDGVTDLYGVLYKPFDLDEGRKYPVIAFVYPGPQTESVPKSFSTSGDNTALAQFGFIVVAVGNRGGNPERSKWYHNYGYGNLRDYGLADKKATIEQLAARFKFIDIDRVGIYGHSGGGFMSTAAMLVYPDFFKVAVSSSGNHENNVYNKNWSEKHDGVKEVVDKDGNVTFEYDIDKNSDLAANLKGRLLLVTGDIDNNVHPANTLRMAQALIKAGKRFDLFIFPGARHSYGDMANYWFWVKADYFTEHLLGDRPRSVDMIELKREMEMNGKREQQTRTTTEAQPR